MIFTPETTPFPYWDGPYSPARGSYTGFRIRGNALGAWVSSSEERSFCEVERSDGIMQLSDLVHRHWIGGRLLFLPSGLIIKPLQGEDDRGIRVVVGRYDGSFRINFENQLFDLLSPTAPFPVGTIWRGPNTIGLECTLRTDGSLTTSWQQPTEFGAEKYQHDISGPNQALMDGFRAARPGDAAGRVRITIGGHVTTKRNTNHGWLTFYVGRVPTNIFNGWDNWKRRR